MSNKVKVKWIGEGLLDNDSWEEFASVSVLKCELCKWIFYGNPFYLDHSSFDSISQDIPNFCPICGGEIDE